MAAENGDAASQNKLGDAYLQWSDTANAAIWYRKAAEKGIANSQYHLGKILAWKGFNFAYNKVVSLDDVNEGLKWYALAARQRCGQAQFDLAQFYEDGKIVQQDYIQAYKWYSLSRECGISILGKIYQDKLILKMTQAQISAGQTKVAEFMSSPDSDISKPQSSFIKKFKLSGITGTKNQPLAIINNRTFGMGESGKVKIDTQSINVRCMHIGRNVAVIKADGFDDLIFLQLN